MAYLTKRTLTPELMDDDDVSIDQLRQSLRFIRLMNRRLGGSSAVLGHLKRWSKSWPNDRPIRILDVATGCADIPLAIARWARQAGHDVQITGVDRHAKTMALAAELVGDEPDVQLLRADALHLPFAPNSFDYCIASLFLHHLSDLEVLTVLRIMDQLSTRGLIWNDLLRSRLAVGACKLMTRFADPIVRHDAVASVRAGFTKREALDFRDRLGLRHLRYRRHLCYRFTLAGKRSGAGPAGT